MYSKKSAMIKIKGQVSYPNGMYSKKSATPKIKGQVSYPRKPRKGEGAFLPPCVGRSGTGMSPLRCRFFDDLLGA